jgi:hypothetical protein
MDNLYQLQQNARIIQDLTANTLAELPGQFARLTYLAGLRDSQTGRYEHAGLSAIYPRESVEQSLALCHEQMLQKILESPLESQELDLKIYFDSLGGDPRDWIGKWKDTGFSAALVPEVAPDYLRKLFHSNLHALLEILDEKCAKARSTGSPNR